MTLATQLYREQLKSWPTAGRHIMAQFDAESIVVYQAYRQSIGRFATQNQYFGGDFSFNRMSWIKPNFLWMMYRSGWGTKEGQEVTLAVYLRREAFERILEQAVHSTFVPEIYDSPENWRARLKDSCVRLQWDPDHDPSGAKQERRALQLGLAGDVLRLYAREWILKIEDISEFVSQERLRAKEQGFANLMTPRERVYPVQNAQVGSDLGLDQMESA